MPAKRQTYEPRPIDTSHVELSPELRRLTEALSSNVHDVWANSRMAEGWRWGKIRDVQRKLHPSLLPYDELPEREKEVDRKVVLGTIKAMLALGYRIEKA